MGARADRGGDGGPSCCLWEVFVFCMLVMGWFVEHWVVKAHRLVKFFDAIQGQSRGFVASADRHSARSVRCQGKSLPKQPGLGRFWIALMVAVFFNARVGEASNPGPDTQQCWTLGTFNPSGVTSKADVVGQLEGDFWGMCETHLSDIGQRRFVHALRCQNSQWKYMVPGSPCELRARSEEVGTFTGVAGLSKWPTRALAHSLHDGWYKTSRVQVVGTFLNHLWIQVAIVYGFPYSKYHHASRFQTEQLLEGAIDRIACQSKGPRVIMGDFNWEHDELTQIRRLEDMGFKDIQTLAWEWWGVPIRPTGKGDRRIDYVFLSPELWPLLQKVVVDGAQWPDHSAVYGVFRGWQPAIEKYHWKMPQSVEWPPDFQAVSYPAIPNQTVAYASFWKQVESNACRAVTDAKGTPWSFGQFGRGQTLETITQRSQQAPIRKSRAGEESPLFYGQSIRYAQQFKQVRRLQALVAIQRKSSSGEGNVGQLWQVIRHAPGFPGGFVAWWGKACYPTHGGPFPLTLQVPSSADCVIIFQAVKQEVQAFAKQLSKERYAFAKDARLRNMRYVYKDCAREPPRKVDVLIDSKASEVEDVDPDGTHCSLLDAVSFDVAKPIVVQGREVSIHSQHGTQLTFAEPVGLQPGDVIRQSSVTAEIPEIFEAFRREWEPRWNRHSRVCDSQWDQICAFAQAHLAPVQWHFPDWNPERFEQIVRSKKSTAATGPDGITRKDLMALPSHAVQSLLQVYHIVEQQAKWPRQLTNGIVSSLEKTPDAQSVRQYRPVVVYPLVYRVWSSARARQFLRSFAKVTPPGLRGGLPACQSKSVWFELAAAVEADHVGQPSLVGLVADLQKAFNTIPRIPLWKCLIALNCPPWLIRAWASFVNQQVRRFKVRSSVGPGIPSDCGYPEGCGLSVCAMAVLDFLLDVWMVHQFPDLQVYTFVDDWQFLHRSVANQQAIEDRMIAFVDLLDMKLDSSKTFTWSTCATARTLLRHGRFRVVHHAKSLGVHANFTKQRGNKTLVDRIKAMGPTWKLLRRSLSPYAAKVASLRVLAWPRALHGIGVTSIADTHFAKLRSGASYGLRCNRVGAHPALRLAQHGFTYDPEGWAILSTIKDFRDFANSAYVENIIGQVGNGSLVLPVNGPIAVLLSRVRRLGWTISACGQFVDEIGEFSIFATHIDALRARIALAWPRLVASEVSHRKSFGNFHQVDLAETTRVFKQFVDADRVYLQCALDGTMYTNHGKDHRKNAGDEANSCPFCSQKDGFFHRMWRCPAFQDLRQKHCSVFLEEVEGLPTCHVSHAWAVKPGSHVELMQYFEAIQPYEVCRYRLDVCDDAQVDLFVDGSCYASKEPALRFASWAVTVAHWKGSPLDHSVVAAGWLPGIHQSAFRGELEAMKHALTVACLLKKPVRIWSDCQGVVSGVRRLQQGLWRLSPNMSHYDLWEQISQCLERWPQVVIMQIYSHILPTVGTSYIEFWGFWHNSLVDIAAGRINTARGDGFWALWNECERELQHCRSRHLGIAKLIVDIGKRADQDSKPEKTALPIASTVSSDVGCEQLIPSSKTWSIPKGAASKFGYPAVAWIHQWWTQTGGNYVKQSGRLQWISFLQLYIDFQLSTGQGGPKLWNSKWYWGDSLQQPDFNPGYVKRCKWFQMLLKRYWDGNGFAYRSRSIRPASGASVVG